MLSMRLLSENFRHGYLLAALLLLVVGRPFLAPAGGTFGLIDGFLLLTLMTAVATSARSALSRGVAVALAVAAVVFRGLSLEAGAASVYEALFSGAMALFCGCSAVLLLLHLFRPRASVTTDTILGAINAYLLIGIAWASAYALLEAVQPGSFSFGGRDVTDPRDLSWTFVGFSYTTLTTLGYGNIAPMTPQADALCTAEAMLGQFYVAVLVGRLVALQLSQQASGSAPGPRGG